MNPPIIHEAITENPDPTKFLPIEVNSAFPEGAKSALTSQEKAQIDKFIEAVPDKNDPVAINYWEKMGDRDVYLEGWCDKCLAGTGYPEMGGGEWQAKIDYMVSDTKRTLIAKQTDGTLSPAYIAAKLPLTLIEGGFREFEAGEKANLYGVSWGVYVKPEAQGNPGNLGGDNMVNPRGGTEVYVEKLPKCDFCGKPALYDARTRMGPWANMCEEHFKMYGVGLGTGKGQKLIPRKALGEAEKIRGKPPKELAVRMTEEDLKAAALEDVWYPVCPYCGAETPAEPDAHYVYCQACNRRFRIINPFFSSGGGVMEEALAERIAERAAVGTANLLGSHIAKEVAKQQEEVLHGSPITERGKARLGEPPLCYDFRGTRSWVLVRSWQRMEKEHLPTLPVGESWSEIRRVCAMSPEMVEAKKPDLCSLTHMEQVPACARYVARERVQAGVR